MTNTMSERFIQYRRGQNVLNLTRKAMRFGME